MFDVCKWPTTLSSIIRSADTAFIDQGADHTDEQVQTKIFTFVSNEFTILGRAGKRFKIKIKISTHTQNPLLVFVPLPLPTPSTSFLFPLRTTTSHSQVTSSPARKQTTVFTYSRHLCRPEATEEEQEVCFIGQSACLDRSLPPDSIWKVI